MRDSIRSLTLTLLAVLTAFTTTTQQVITQSPSYGVVDIGTLGGPTSVALAMEYYGYEIVGSAATTSSPRRAFVGNPYFPLRDLGSLGGQQSEAAAISPAGIVGSAQTPSGSFHAFLWQSHSPGMIDLGTLGGTSSWAYGINEGGVVVGAATNASGNMRAFLYRDGATNELTLASVDESEARDINNGSQIIGWKKTGPNSPARAFLWENQVETSLGTLIPGGESRAMAINNQGVVVGFASTDATGAATQAFRWENGVMQPLPGLGGAKSAATAIGENGTIVGWSLTPQGESHAVIWRDGKVEDLNHLIKPNSGWVLDAAHDVGNRDAIVGVGTKDGVRRAFLAPPPIDIEVTVDRNPLEVDPNFPNPHEAGKLLTLSAAAYNNSGDFPATNVVIRDTISGPVEYVDWFDADCVKDGQALTCKLPTFETIGRAVMIRVRATGPGVITHAASLLSSDQVDSTPDNNADSQTNVAVSLAQFTLAQSSVIGGKPVLGRATLTSTTPMGGARVTLTSSHPDVASVPSEFDVLPGANDGLWREFYVTTKPVTTPVTVQISATYGQRTLTQSLTINPSGSSPGSGARPVPGRIHAEDFDDGAQNVSFFDTTSGNSGGAYRTTDVDIEPTSDAGGGYNVGWMAAGEWLQYTVAVSDAGTYRLSLRVAANGAGGRVYVEFDGVNKTGPLTIPNTSSWQNWTTIGADVTLSAGTQRMRVVVESAGPTGVVGNLNYIDVTAPAPVSTPYTGTPIAIPGIIQAENFDNGGANVAYRDTTNGNSGGAYRSTDVDIQATKDVGGGHNVGWMAPGEWLQYTINVPTAATYLLKLRFASTGGGSQVHFEFDGINTQQIELWNTGGWQNWDTVSVPVALKRGVQRMRLIVDLASPSGVVGNVNFIELANTAQPTARDIVIYPGSVPNHLIFGHWEKTIDPTSFGSAKLATPDEGFATTAAPLASPTHFFEMWFDPVPNTPYTLWLRLKAKNNDKFNDAVWVQFSAAHVNGKPVYPIGSTSGLLVNLATDAGATSLNNWGWANGAYWLSQPATFTFPTGGTQFIRIQTREDGVEIDHIVLSPSQYVTTPPGGPTNDTTHVK
jgi:probable HAF family extracellular repeat protein